MIWFLIVAAYLVGGSYLVYRNLVPRMVEERYEEMDGFKYSYKEPGERLKEIRETKTEALVISLGIGLFGMFPLYFVFQFLRNHSLASGPVCDRELQDRLSAREEYIKHLEKEAGVNEGR